MAEVKWTNEQLQAIQEKDSNILVAAAAGSGKTAVLVERIIHKIIDEQMDIDKILVVTFTNAAASEMRERILEAIYKKLEENPENVHLQRQIILLNKASICTIHSFCLDVIHNHFYEIDLPSNFKIADTAEIDLLKQEVLDDLFEQKYTENDKDFIELLENYTNYRGDEALQELVLKIYKFIQSSPFPIKWLQEKLELLKIEDLPNILLINGEPLLMQTENKIIPTLKAVLSLEITEKYATVDMGAINFVIKGADIMSPGIVDADKTIVAGETIVIIEETHKKPIAIGTSLISGEEMIENSKGKAIENLHYVGDTIWDLKI